MYKICSMCSNELHIVNFYSNGYTPKGNKKYKPTCINCEANRRLELYVQKLELLVGILRCSNCGYNKNLAALEFHHLNPNTKENSISKMKTASLSRLKIEINKCILLCANCHREYHNPLYKLI